MHVNGQLMRCPGRDLEGPLAPQPRLRSTKPAAGEALDLLSLPRAGCGAGCEGGGGGSQPALCSFSAFVLGLVCALRLPGLLPGLRLPPPGATPQGADLAALLENLCKEEVRSQRAAQPDRPLLGVSSGSLTGGRRTGRPSPGPLAEPSRGLPSLLNASAAPLAEGSSARNGETEAPLALAPHFIAVCQDSLGDSSMGEVKISASLGASVHLAICRTHTHFFTWDPRAGLCWSGSLWGDAGLGMIEPGLSPRPVTCQWSC